MRVSPTPPPPPVVGISVGTGIVVYKLVARPGGGPPSRVEVGRTRFRHPANPSYPSCVALSRRYFVFPEAPLYVDMLAIMGVNKYASDDDEERSNRYYCLNWQPKVGMRVGGRGGEGRGATKATRSSA